MGRSVEEPGRASESLGGEICCHSVFWGSSGSLSLDSKLLQAFSPLFYLCPGPLVCVSNTFSFLLLLLLFWM